jgi:hypothetical protein
MRRILTAVSLLALGAVPAFAADDIMAGYYGNTAVVTGGMIESHTHYRADHTFDLTATAMGTTYTFKGTWKIDGKGQLCRTYADPAPPNTPNPLCTVIAPHKVGDSWTMTMNGNTRTIKLVAGVQ